MSKKKVIGVVAGGFSGEHVISLKSAEMVMQHIDRDKYVPYLVLIDNDGWRGEVDGEWLNLDRDDFTIETKGGKIHFDGCFIIIHGAPGENGVLQGYFRLIGMPHTTGDVFNMSLTFNKSATNSLLRQLGFNTAKNMLVRRDDHYSSSDIVMNLGMPIFAKPNNGGSSIAISKVTAKEGLHRAIHLALQADDSVILEQFIEGTEVTCGVIQVDGEITPLPPTEIVSHTDFFDYEAKYEGKSEEITPARIGDGTTQRIQELSARIYDLLNCRGMIRVDYIIQDGVPHIVEVNTVPGFSTESIIPQQAEVAGIDKKTLITHVIESCF
ncbi:MAG: D-alanine--D-alanine ligase [Flavobacteriales bacterium]|nr:D-alanine--D-alanine ligase [Flavobacteriales bacterium]